VNTAKEATTLSSQKSEIADFTHEITSHNPVHCTMMA